MEFTALLVSSAFTTEYSSKCARRRAVGLREFFGGGKRKIKQLAKGRVHADGRAMYGTLWTKLGACSSGCAANLGIARAGGIWCAVSLFSYDRTKFRLICDKFHRDLSTESSATAVKVWRCCRRTE
jgi:hypothetical protein